MINEWKAFFERHREGVLGTVIFHLLLLIVLVSVGISRERERQVMEVVMDLPTEEETEQARAERERKEEMEQRTTEGEVERMLRSLAVNEEESRETSMAEGNERERVEEYIRELERELEEGRKARGETDKGNGEMTLARGEREADSLAYERTRRERELDSLRSTVYAGRSSVTYRLEGRHKVVLPIPVFKCEFGGRVVVAVTVDREGRVTRAEVVERESKVDDCLRTVAVEAARESVFNAKEDAPERQEGTITYNFVKQ